MYVCIRENHTIQRIHLSYLSSLSSVFPPGGVSDWLIQRAVLWPLFQEHGGLLGLPERYGFGGGAELRLHVLHWPPQREPL